MTQGRAVAIFLAVVRSRLRQALPIAVLALALLPVAASAHGFVAASYPITAAATQEVTPVLTTEGGKVECESTTMTAPLAEGSGRLELTPTFAKCKAFGFLEATFTTTGCLLVLRGGEEVSAGKFSGVVDIECESGKAMTVKASNCEMKIESQEGLGTATYENHEGASPPNFTVELALKAIGYTVTKDGLLCPFGGTGAKTGGTFTATMLMKGSNGGGGVGFVIFRHTELCKTIPKAGPPLTCKKGDAYTEKTISGALSSSIASWAGTGMEVRCTGSTFSGELQREGGSDSGEGITAWAFNSGGDCGSTAIGQPTVTVVVENLSYDETAASYQPGVASQGQLAVAKTMGVKVQVKFTVHTTPSAVICQYQPSSGLVASWYNGTGLSTSSVEFLNQAFTRVSGSGPCPTTTSFNAIYTISRGGGGNLYLAN